MINFQEELEKYDFFAVDVQFAAMQHETNRVIEVVNSTLKRFSKELNNANLQLEEIMSEFLEAKEQDEYKNELQKKLAAFEEEKLVLVQGLVSILDQVEDIYRYSLQNEGGGWLEQIELVWKNIAAKLLVLGITRIEGENTLFDAQLHSAVEVREDGDYADGVILEVLRCGYIYQSQVWRKAQVIVNKTKGCENDEHSCGY